jgi:hypothetical protein
LERDLSLTAQLEAVRFLSNDKFDPCLFVSDKVICVVYEDDTLCQDQVIQNLRLIVNCEEPVQVCALRLQLPMHMVEQVAASDCTTEAEYNALLDEIHKSDSLADVA